MNITAANIAYYRTLLNVKQKELEDHLGISRTTFKRKCENDGFTVKELKIMANLLHIKVMDLVKGM